MTLKKIFKKMWLRGLMFIIPLSILASIADLSMLAGIRIFISMVSGNWTNAFFNPPWLENIDAVPWIIAMVLIIILRYTFITLKARSEERTSCNIESYLRVWWMSSIRNLHPLRFHELETESILQNSHSSISSLSKSSVIASQSVQAISQLLFFVPILFYISWQLTLILLCIFAPVVILLQRNLKSSEIKKDSFYELSNNLHTDLWRWKALRLSWNNNTEMSRMTSELFRKIKNLKRLSIKVGVNDIMIIQNIESLSIMVMCFVLGLCAFFVNKGIMNSFDIILFCAALFICYKPLKECSKLSSQLRDMILSFRHLHRLEKMGRKINLFEQHDDQSICLQNISFNYDKKEKPVFSNLNFEIKLNKPLLIQGMNGSGKTTLLRILSGLEIPKSGKILMPPNAKKGSFYLSQRLHLPPISWLKDEINKKEWGTYTKAFFKELSIDNLMNKRGHSNGELQRIMLAWAVVSGAPLLFLDEPFAFIAQNMREPIFKSFWNATIEMEQWWMMASHELPPEEFKKRISVWNLNLVSQ